MLRSSLCSEATAAALKLLGDAGASSAAAQLLEALIPCPDVRFSDEISSRMFQISARSLSALMHQFHRAA